MDKEKIQNENPFFRSKSKTKPGINFLRKSMSVKKDYPLPVG